MSSILWLSVMICSSLELTPSHLSASRPSLVRLPCKLSLELEVSLLARPHQSSSVASRFLLLELGVLVRELVLVLELELVRELLPVQELEQV